MIKKIREIIREQDLIRENQHIVLGLSGGPDSVCLFHLLLQLSHEMSLTIHPVHVNHGLRPGAADEDQRYTEALCKAAGCTCQSYVFDCAAFARQERITDEEAGRKLRYGAFAETAEGLKKKGVPAGDIRIAVAQNADDQAETILFRLLRGAGTEGLSGIRSKRTDEHGNIIVRPLLTVSRREILAYCRENGLQPRIDQTNGQPVYTRNRIRLQLIPYLEQEYNPEIKDTLIRMGASAAMDADYLRRQAQQLYPGLLLERKEDRLLLRGAELRQLHRAVRQRILSLAFGEIGLRDDLSFVHYEQCEKIIFHGEPSARCDLPRGYRLSRIYEDVCVSAPSAVQRERDCRFRTEVMTAETFSAVRREKSKCAVFDYDQMEKTFGEGFPDRLRLDFRQEGDVIAIAGGKHKKIQDLFVDCKVPREERSSVRLLKLGSQVLWVIFPDGKCRYSADFKLSAETKKVICVEII